MRKEGGGGGSDLAAMVAGNGSDAFPGMGLIGSLVREEGHISSLAASGDLLYTGSDSKNIRVWKRQQDFVGFKSSSGLHLDPLRLADHHLDPVLRRGGSEERPGEELRLDLGRGLHCPQCRRCPGGDAVDPQREERRCSGGRGGGGGSGGEEGDGEGVERAVTVHVGAVEEEGEGMVEVEAGAGEGGEEATVAPVEGGKPPALPEAAQATVDFSTTVTCAAPFLAKKKAVQPPMTPPPHTTTRFAVLASPLPRVEAADSDSMDAVDASGAAGSVSHGGGKTAKDVGHGGLGGAASPATDLFVGPRLVFLV